MQRSEKDIARAAIERAVVEYLTENGPQDAPTVARAIGVDERAVWGAIERLQGAGTVAQVAWRNRRQVFAAQDAAPPPAVWVNDGRTLWPS